jgi:hypothetical protein
VTNAEAQAREQAIDQALAGGVLGQAERQALAYLAGSGPARPDHDPARALWFRASYLAAQVSLAAGRLAQASELLAPCLAVAERLPEELAARVRLLAAEALARLRRGAEARPLLERVPSLLLARHPLLHLRALRIRLWLGELAQIEKEIVTCGSALEARGDTSNRALLLCEEGCARDAAGDLDGAERCWQRAELLTRATAADPIRAAVLLQLGRIDHLRGRLPSALGRYGEALAAAGDGPHALEVRLRRLLVLLDADQWPQARLLAQELLAGPEQLPEEVRPVAGLVRALLGGEAPPEPSVEQQAYDAAADGDAEAARRLYLRALASERSPERQARLALALGLLALGQAGRADADSWLRRAEALARERDLPDILWRALDGRGQVAAELDGDEIGAERLWAEAAVVCEAEGRQSGVLRRLLRAACRRAAHDPDAPARVFHFQEMDRGRLLLDLWRGAARPELSAFFTRPEIADRERQVAACEKELGQVAAGAEGSRQRKALLRRRAELRGQLDRLRQEFLRSRSRRASSALPALPSLAELRRCLPRETLYLAPSLLGEELYLLAATREGPARMIRATNSAAALPAALATLRDCLDRQLTRYRVGLPLGPAERAELDGLLGALGDGPLGDVLSQALREAPAPRRLLWVPDGPLHGLPLAALRLRDEYLVEKAEIVSLFSGSWLVHQARARRRTRGPWRPMLVVTESPEVLPEASREGKGVAASCLFSRTLHGPAATRAALRRALTGARAAHFACHAHFDAEQPLAAHLSGSCHK